MDWVDVIYVDTGKVIRIPRSELAVGMVRIRIEGKDGVYWAESKQLKRGTVPKHPHFQGELKKQIQEIQKILYPVRGMSYEEWEEPFRCDAHPEKEIALWSAVARRFDVLAKERFATQDEKNDVYEILACVLQGGRNADVILPSLSTLNRNQTEELIVKFSEVVEKG